MERFSSRDNDVLVDCSTPQKATFGHSFSSRNLPRNSDIDFNDVFGGPPRRSSIQEPRHSFSEAADPYRNRVSDEIPLYGDPWAGEHEKPVFGGENMSRKRFVSEEFFDDIFRGNESANSTPRKPDRDVFSSSPGSRVLSPARPLPPRAEPLLNSSVPSQFSLPVKMSKPMDLPMSGSGALKPHKHKDGSLNGASHLHSPKVSVLGFPNGAIQAQDESKYAIHSSYRRSPLSHEFSLRGEESFDKGTDGQQDLVSNVPFHFSIYKWASKGIPMVMPLRRVNSSKSKQKGKSETSNLNDQTESQNGITQSALPSMETVTVGPSSLRSDVPKTVSSGVEPGKFENDMLKKSSSRVEVESCHVVEEASIQKQKQDNYENDHYEAVSCNVREETKVSSLSQYENDHYEAVPCNVREETKVSSLPWVGMSQTTEKEIWRQTEKASKPALKTLHSLLSEQDDEQAKRENGIRRKMEGNVTKPRIAEQSLAHDDTGIGVKKKEGIHGLNSERAMKVTSQGSSRNSQDGTDRRIENGKVKEFIKIFNQEAPLKPKVEVRQNKSFRWSERGVKEDYQWNHANKELHGQESMSNVKTSDAIPSNPTPDIRQFHEKPESTQSATPASSVLFSDVSQKNSSASSTESAPDDARATAIEEDESFSGRFLVKELGQDEDKQREQSDIDVEDIQVIDAKIRQWSHGKEGNIRSLLSTLQYVLWPRTGWKPVPLVDIVEGPAVKRAYQKALLCLHPDKLQQKGAASHQKYTAERVFDILQESWTHFNSLGSL